MKLKRYRDNYNTGCKDDPKGEYVKYEDVMKLLREIEDRIVDLGYGSGDEYIVTEVIGVNE